MYRLLGYKSSQNVRLLINRKKCIENTTQNFHTLLNHKNRLLTLTDQPKVQQTVSSSSIINAELLKKMVKRKKRKKKYTELLQVTSNSTKETTTLVQNLKAKKLSNFIQGASPSLTTSSTKINQNLPQIVSTESSDVQNHLPIVFVGDNIDELKLTTDKLREIIDSYNAYRESNTEEISHEGVLEATEAIEEEAAAEELLEEDEHHEIIPEVIPEKIPKLKTRFQGSSGSKIIDTELRMKQKSLAISLRAFIDCCVQNGMVNRGYLSIIRYRWRCKKAGMYGVKITDVTVYNLLMRGYSEKENFLKLKEIMGIIKEDHLRPNEQTYAIFLDCLGRLSHNDSSFAKNKIENFKELDETIQKVLDEASYHKISPKDIMDKTIFVKDQREMVLDAIRRINPDFMPEYSKPELLYNNHLVNALNEGINPIEYDPIKNLHVKCSGSEIMDSKRGFSRDDLEKWGREQLLNELNGEITIKSILKYPTPSLKVLSYRDKLNELHKRWRECIISSFNRDFNVLRMEEMRLRGNQNLLPYLRTLEVEQYADILLNEIRRLTEGSETYSPYLSQLYRCLGEKVEMRFHIEQKMKLGVLQKTGEVYGNYCDVIAAGNSNDNSRQSWQRIVYHSKGDGVSMEFHHQGWPIGAKIGVGKFLYNILIRDLKLDPNFLRTGKHQCENLIPAFFTLFRHQAKNVKEELKPHPMLMKLYRGSQQETLTFDVNLVPMVCPPQPYWTPKNGGYLVAHSDFLRLPPNAYQQLEMVDDAPVQNLYPIFDALNQQQSVAWRINTEMLDLVISVFNKGGDDKLDIPEVPDNLPAPQAPVNDGSLSNFEKFRFFREKLTHRKKQAEMYSLWCDAHYKLSLANHYRDRIFWLPQNLDFRGRLYSIPPHLSHLGADLGRSLLMFHQKKKLGIDGLSWLKLHCINLTGLKKRDSVRERLLYAEEVLDEIFDSADNPLDGRRWWTKSDEPWQTLAVCKEITKAIRSGDPENYESCIPVHQDGSCNGLQHYAALGRDTLGAQSVNLTPSERPQDVYSDVAQLVEQTRQKEEDNNVQVAKVLRNFIARKVIKQTVMTTVYGVTKYGARLQIAKQLKDLDDFPKEWVWAASTFLASKTFDSIREMFCSTREIQDWFVDCARLISTVCNENVEWVTPLGLPIVQPYSRGKPKTSKKLDENNVMSRTPNALKQKNAFPPNYIHSLDSCHMMLTSVHCEKIGLTFTSVHDCYWTHACTVPEMSKICREQFVALHSEPLLEDLSRFLVKKYSFSKNQMLSDGSVEDMTRRKLNRVLTMVPKKGDFQLENVLDSIYFFS